ncbi:hypothetical protein BX070DRAFT_57746 [Coemansia spiralis]|nr:hypothetical protein BX070DRAFT_57746 [Coemansia spiralis]
MLTNDLVFRECPMSKLSWLLLETVMASAMFFAEFLPAFLIATSACGPRTGEGVALEMWTVFALEMFISLLSLLAGLAGGVSGSVMLWPPGCSPLAEVEAEVAIAIAVCIGAGAGFGADADADADVSDADWLSFLAGPDLVSTAAAHFLSLASLGHLPMKWPSVLQ